MKDECLKKDSFDYLKLGMLVYIIRGQFFGVIWIVERVDFDSRIWFVTDQWYLCFQVYLLDLKVCVLDPHFEIKQVSLELEQEGIANLEKSSRLTGWMIDGFTEQVHSPTVNESELRDVLTDRFAKSFDSTDH